MSNHKLIIIRGPSGSGKSTIARHLGGQPKNNHFEADMYFDKNGHYNFDANKLGAAHAWCQAQTHAAMARGEATVIVSNTSMTLAELKPYLDAALRHGYAVTIYRTPKPWCVEVLKGRNAHGVPYQVISKQINKYAATQQETEWTNVEIFK